MPAPDKPIADRTVLLACSVRGLRGYWLQVRCSCRRYNTISLRTLATNHTLAEVSIADVLVKLRCEACGERPIAVALASDQTAGAYGKIGDPGWRVMLVGDDAPTGNAPGLAS